MKSDEYDELIYNPTGFLYNTWLPRVSSEIEAPGSNNSYRNNLALVKGGMAMLSYFNAFGEQNMRLRTESGTVSAISGILKAPFDIIADKLRGYVGLMMDMHTQPKKVLAACEALMPHLLYVARSGADTDRNVPVGFWMHRGCVPFISPEWFGSHYWSTLKPIIEGLWAQGHQTLFYAEGDWNHHLDAFATLPESSIVYHADRANIFEIRRKLGYKFCLSGGVPNYLLAVGTPEEVRDCCKAIIDGVAAEGAYIMDASAIVQNDAKIENIKAMTDFTREYGVYSSGHSDELGQSTQPVKSAEDFPLPTSIEPGEQSYPGVCQPWSSRASDAGLSSIPGDEALVKKVWREVDEFGYTFIWQCLLSF